MSMILMFLIFFVPPFHEQGITLGDFYGLQKSSQTVSLLRRLGDAMS